MIPSMNWKQPNRLSKTRLCRRCPYLCRHRAVQYLHFCVQHPPDSIGGGLAQIAGTTGRRQIADLDGLDQAAAVLEIQCGLGHHLLVQRLVLRVGQAASICFGKRVEGLAAGDQLIRVFGNLFRVLVAGHEAALADAVLGQHRGHASQIADGRHLLVRDLDHDVLGHAHPLRGEGTGHDNEQDEDGEADGQAFSDLEVLEHEGGFDGVRWVEPVHLAEAVAVHARGAMSVPE